MPTPEIEASYPLTPMQQGMFFHHLSAPGAGVDLEQIVAILREDIDADRFEQAWNRVIARHPVLRTSFRWVGEPRPVQVVNRSATLGVVRRDLREMSAANREEQIEQYLAADRARGFRFDVAPLARVALFRTGAAEWRFVWSFPHILLDGSAFPLVLRELFAIYESGLDAERALPARRPFRDYVEWLSARPSADDETFWRGVLRGFTAPTPVGLNLPIDGGTGRGEREIRLSADTTARLRALAAEHELGLSTLLYAAWAILLGRYAREEDVVFGTTLAGRRGALDGADEIVGMLINTIPVRVRLASDQPLLELLRAIRDFQTSVRAHERAALADVQRWSDVPGGTALFDSLLVYDARTLDSTLRSEGGAWERREFRLLDRTNIPLTINVYGEPALWIKASYDRPRLDDATATRLLGHFATLLESIAADPARAVGDLPMLAPDERRELLYEWNDAGRDFPVEQTIHAMFEARAAAAPDTVAVVYENQALTYGELDARANRLAHFLRARGVGPEVLVGMYLERSLDMIVAIVGILKAGGAYVPLDPAYPKERVAFMLEDARAPVLLTQSSMADRVPEHGASVVMLDTDWPEIARFDDGRLESGATPASLAYVIYTSGSTGKPKGVLIPHSNVVRLMLATEHWFHFDDRDVWTMFHSYAFDFSVWEIWGALLYGGRLVVVPYAVSRSPEDFFALLARERVTFLNQTPSAFRQIVQVDEAATTRPELALRVVVFGGEALDFQSLAPWFERHGDTMPQLVNMYGITETTVHVTYQPLTAADASGESGSVIGRPIPDLQLYLLGDRLQPVPIGVAGEIQVGGAGVARGYLNRPELTAQRFVRDPFTSRPGATLYKAGDLARYLPDGNLEYLGRIDHQVKIRGFRIELGEIEAQLQSHPDVRDAVVLAREDVPGDKRLVAYVVARSAEPPSTQELRELLRAALPEYMVPAHFVFLDAMPLTQNGKADRKALPAPDTRGQGAASGHVAPRDALETQLVEIWERVLNVSPIGIEDNFFDLGGHSFLAITLFAEISAHLTKKLPLATLVRAPTVARLAEVMRRMDQTAAESALVAIHPDGWKPPLFLVHRQGEDVLVYRDLAAHLTYMEPGQPLIGVKALGERDDLAVHTNIVDMARHAIRAMRERQPEGPYYLGGLSFGGAVAYEMACQLEAAGERVALLALIESFPPSVMYLSRRVKKHLFHLARLTTGAKVDYLVRAMRNIERRVLGKLRRREAGAALVPPPPGTQDLDYDPLEERGSVVRSAFEQFKPKRYGGRITLFKAAVNEVDPFAAPDFEWGTLARSVEIHTVPGGHISLLAEPHVRVLAEALHASLTAAQAGEPSAVPVGAGA